MVGGSSEEDMKPSNDTYVMTLPKDFESNSINDDLIQWLPFKKTVTARLECTSCILQDYLYIFGYHLKDQNQLTCDRINLSDPEAEF